MQYSRIRDLREDNDLTQREMGKYYVALRESTATMSVETWTSLQRSSLNLRSIIIHPQIISWV